MWYLPMWCFWISVWQLCMCKTERKKLHLFQFCLCTCVSELIETWHEAFFHCSVGKFTDQFMAKHLIWLHYITSTNEISIICWSLLIVSQYRSRVPWINSYQYNTFGWSLHQYRQQRKSRRYQQQRLPIDALSFNLFWLFVLIFTRQILFFFLTDLSKFIFV